MSTTSTTTTTTRDRGDRYGPMELAQQVHESPVSVAERDSQPSTMTPPKNLIRFARITELVLGSPGEQLLHLLHTSYTPLIQRSLTQSLFNCHTRGLAYMTRVCQKESLSISEL